jgi:drug/metabolite transporter (DMT)-like permease
MEHVGPLLFNGIRQALGALTLAAAIGIMVLAACLRKRYWPGGRTARGSEAADKGSAAADKGGTGRTTFWRRQLWRILLPGTACGAVLFVASNLQQAGMVYTTASKAGFITTLYIVLVPLIGMAFRHRTHWNTWLSVLIAVVGLYFLCMSEGLEVAPGDAILLCSALFWALHILFVDRFVAGLRQKDVMWLCVVQFSVAAVLSLLVAPALDQLFVPRPVTLDALTVIAPEIAYAGVLSTGVAFTLAAIGQKYAAPSAAAIVMSLEAAFGLLGGVVLLSEALSLREAVGCVLMFSAVTLAQVQFKRRKLKRRAA